MKKIFNLLRRIALHPLFYAVVACVLMNYFLGMIPFEKYIVPTGIKNTLKHQISYTAIWSVFSLLPLLLFLWNRWLLRLTALCVLALYAFYGYYAYISVAAAAQFRLNSVTLAFVLDTDFHEAKELLMGIEGLDKFILHFVLIPFLFIAFWPVRACTPTKKDLYTFYKTVKNKLNKAGSFIVCFAKKYRKQIIITSCFSLIIFGGGTFGKGNLSFLKTRWLR